MVSSIHFGGIDAHALMPTKHKTVTKASNASSFNAPLKTTPEPVKIAPVTTTAPILVNAAEVVIAADNAFLRSLQAQRKYSWEK